MEHARPGNGVQAEQLYPDAAGVPADRPGRPTWRPDCEWDRFMTYFGVAVCRRDS